MNNAMRNCDENPTALSRSYRNYKITGSPHPDHLTYQSSSYISVIAYCGTLYFSPLGLQRKMGHEGEFLAIPDPSGPDEFHVTNECPARLPPRYLRFRADPWEYKMKIIAKDKDMNEFKLKAIFIVSPNFDEHGVNLASGDETTGGQDSENKKDAVSKYAKLVKKTGDNLETVIMGIAQGEAHVQVSSMSSDEILADEEKFAERLFDKISATLKETAGVIVQQEDVSRVAVLQPHVN